MIFGTDSSILNIGLMKCGRTRWQEAEATIKRFQYCIDPSGQGILYLRALHYVLIPNNFFEYIYHIGCAVNLHSITNSGLPAGGQNLGKDKQTVIFTAVDLVNKEHKDPCEIDLNAPRLAWYKQKKWKRHQDTVYWVDIQLAQQKGFKFYQTRSNAIILLRHTSSFCISKVVVIWRNYIRESLCVTSASSFNDFFQRQLDERMGF